MQNVSLVLRGEESTQMKHIAMMIQKASVYRSTIYVIAGERRANAKSLLGMMSLGVTPGDEIRIEAEGEDEAVAVRELAAWLEELQPESVTFGN